MTPSEPPRGRARGRRPGSKNKPKVKVPRKKAKPEPPEEKGYTRIYADGKGGFLPFDPIEPSQPKRPERAPKPETFAPAPEHPKGYMRIYVDEGGRELAAPVDEPTPVKLPAPPPADRPPVELVEVAVASDTEQRKLIDEYGELDRRMQLHAAEVSRYEFLKKLIKSWFDQAPADADGAVEGEVYRLHLTARERERRVRDLRELAEVIGMDKLLELVTVRIGVLEDLLGKARVELLTVEERSGSRRIKAIPKRPAAAIV